ncbi:hypothetical protein RKD28_007174 [Streptomyces sp. SAI-229]
MSGIVLCGRTMRYGSWCARKILVVPQAGHVELTYQSFDIHDAPGQQLLVGVPEPGSQRRGDGGAVRDDRPHPTPSAAAHPK